jgi:hypothetical protein
MLLSIFVTQPTDIWHDPLILTMLGIAATLLAGIIGAIVAYGIYRRQRNKKEFTRQILSDLSIISKQPIAEESIGSQVENRLKIIFDGKPVEDLRLVSLKVWNSGNVDAQIHNSKQTHTQQSDVETPIGFEFPGRQVVSGVVETEPPTGVIEPEKMRDYVALYLTPAPPTNGLFQNIRMHLSLPLVRIGNTNSVMAAEAIADFVELPPCLLKPSQSIILRLLVIGSKGDIVKRGNLVDWTIVDFDPEKWRNTISISSRLVYALITSILAEFIFVILGLTGRASIDSSFIYIFPFSLFLF